MHLYIVMYNLLLYMLDIIRGRGRLSPRASLWVLLIVGALFPTYFYIVVDTRRGCHTLKLKNPLQIFMDIILNKTGPFYPEFNNTTYPRKAVS
jgi:hypothetical protein